MDVAFQTQVTISGGAKQTSNRRRHRRNRKHGGAKAAERKPEAPVIIEDCLAKPAKTVETLEQLIRELHRVFEADCIDTEHVTQLMLSYKSNPAEWKKYAKFDRFRYTRNLVDEGNGKFNLMILCWGEGHASAIHDHSDAHCFMKMLKGELEEVRYAWPSEHDPSTKTKLSVDDDCCRPPGNNNHHPGNIMDVTTADIKSRVASDPQTPNANGCAQNGGQQDCEDDGLESEMVELGRARLETNGVCYINDSLGLHRVENPSHVDGAVSLHLYCPPFDACHVFNQRTGHRTTCKVTFWSKYGEKRNREIQESRAPEDN